MRYLISSQLKIWTFESFRFLLCTLDDAQLQVVKCRMKSILIHKSVKVMTQIVSSLKTGRGGWLCRRQPLLCKTAIFFSFFHIFMSKFTWISLVMELSPFAFWERHQCHCFKTKKGRCFWTKREPRESSFRLKCLELQPLNLPGTVNNSTSVIELRLLLNRLKGVTSLLWKICLKNLISKSKEIITIRIIIINNILI